MILIVEDHCDTGQIVRRLLNRDGYESHCIESGRNALSLTRDLCPRLIILDYMLPDADGIQILRALKSDPLLRDIPVIMYSAVDDRAMVKSAMEAGAARWFTKGRDSWDSILAGVRSLYPKQRSDC